MFLLSSKTTRYSKSDCFLFRQLQIKIFIRYFSLHKITNYLTESLKSKWFKKEEACESLQSRTIIILNKIHPLNHLNSHFHFINDFFLAVMSHTYCVKTRSTLQFGPRRLSAPLPQMPVLPTGFLTKQKIRIRHHNMIFWVCQSASSFAKIISSTIEPVLVQGPRLWPAIVNDGGEVLGKWTEGQLIWKIWKQDLNRRVSVNHLPNDLTRPGCPLRLRRRNMLGRMRWSSPAMGQPTDQLVKCGK